MSAEISAFDILAHDTPPGTSGLRFSRYECDLSERSIPPALLPRIPTRYLLESFILREHNIAGEADKLGYIAHWIKQLLHQTPAGIDVARDVDGGGFTKETITPTVFTKWIDLGSGLHGRFSESRTAMHNTMLTTKGVANGGALRSPVMNGLALEVTEDPESLDPRSALTTAVLEYPKTEDARYPWVEPHPGQLFDFSTIGPEPYFVGPLYGGHPNRVTDPVVIEKFTQAATMLIRMTVEQEANLI